MTACIWCRRQRVVGRGESFCFVFSRPWASCKGATVHLCCEIQSSMTWPSARTGVVSCCAACMGSWEAREEARSGRNPFAPFGGSQLGCPFQTVLQGKSAARPLSAGAHVKCARVQRINIGELVNRVPQAKRQTALALCWFSQRTGFVKHSVPQTQASVGLL